MRNLEAEGKTEFVAGCHWCCKDEDLGLSCGNCQSCVLSSTLLRTTQWFLKAGELAKRKFLTGVIARCENSGILENISNVLKVTMGKDFTYARSRVKPGLSGDASHCFYGSNRALDPEILREEITQTWDWFSHSSNWTKSNYLMGILSLCETELLHILGNLTHVLLVREKKWPPTIRSGDLQDEITSIPESHYSYSSDGNPDLELLICASSGYGAVDLPYHCQDDDVMETPRDTGCGSLTTASDSRRKEASYAGYSVTSGCDDGGDASDADSAYSDDPALMVVPNSARSLSGVGRYRDFIRRLPVHISKRILDLLDNTSLHRCLSVSQHWRYLTKEIQEDHCVKKLLEKKVMLLQGNTKSVNPTYARFQDVLVPAKDEEKFIYHGELCTRTRKVSKRNKKREQNRRLGAGLVWICYTLCYMLYMLYFMLYAILYTLFCTSSAKGFEGVYTGVITKTVQMIRARGFEGVYTGVITKAVEMEERNVFCGAYNILLLTSREDPLRVTHYAGGQLAVMGSKDRVVRLVDVVAQKEVLPAMHGHAGSIHAVLLCEAKGMVISAGYDLSIRCWNMKTGACTSLLRGHMATINCLDVHGDRLVSGAKDCKVKVWNLKSGKCEESLKFKHHHPILCVKISSTYVLSSCSEGLVKMWSLELACILKVMEAHKGSVGCLFYDDWHILTGGTDGQAVAWSANPDFKKCLMTYRHPLEVLSVTCLYLRAITACVDGKIRIFNFVTGDCIRVIKACGQNSPVHTVHVTENNMVVDTEGGVYLLQFPKVIWDYVTSSEGEVLKNRVEATGSILQKQSASNVRAERMGLIGSPSHKLLQHVGQEDEGRGQSHHARSVSVLSMQRARGRETSLARSELSRSEKALLRRVQKRGAHRPATPEHMLLTLSSSQLCPLDEPLRSNMELNARVRDAWGPPPPSPSPPYPKPDPPHATPPTSSSPSTHVPRSGGVRSGTKIASPPPLVEGRSQPNAPVMPQPSLYKRSNVIYTPLRHLSSEPNLTPSPRSDPRHRAQKRQVRSCVTTPSQDWSGVKGRSTPLQTPRKRPQTAGTGRTAACKVSTPSSLARGDSCTPHRHHPPPPPSPPLRMFPLSPGGGKRPARHVDFESPPTAHHNPLDPYRQHTGFRLRTDTQLEEYVREQTQMARRENARAQAEEAERVRPGAHNPRRRKTTVWGVRAKGLPCKDFTKEGQVYAPELGPDVYI
ncbi:F-box/WD repeat-containing protein 10 [Clupea harengus]|uniref:F-box/WD repeat-containing protein 10 n=1 Tax=Clupea harengus TaxID=7950 RepID=A0A8M1K5Z3_CLUHA|nr:F-box/WD repeat-containing protein 10 [Clupea harengus]